MNLRTRIGRISQAALAALVLVPAFASAGVIIPPQANPPGPVFPLPPAPPQAGPEPTPPPPPPVPNPPVPNPPTPNPPTPNPPAQQTPEPGTLVLGGMGLATAASYWAARRRKKPR